MLEILSGVFLIFVLSLELRPDMGNVWWRIGADGSYHFSWGGLCQIFVAPFHHMVLWTPRFWDINPYVLIPAVSGAITLLWQRGQRKT